VKLSNVFVKRKENSERRNLDAFIDLTLELRPNKSLTVILV